MRFNVTRVLSLLLLITVGLLADPVQAEVGLQIYLPRDITVHSSVPKLGQVAIIRGNDALANQVNDIALGRISLPGQAVVIDRRQILSRLASHGIEATQVNLTGALKTTITQTHQVISGDALVAKALAFLKANQTDSSICRYHPVRSPKDVVVSGYGQETQISVQPLKSPSPIQSGAIVSVFSDGQKVAQQEVIFQLKFRCHRLVTQKAIDRGERISMDNVKIQQGVADYPEALHRNGWIQAELSGKGEPGIPSALIASRSIPIDTVLQKGMVGPVEPKMLVKRRQSVVIRFEQFGLTVTAVGLAEQDGHLGEIIKVRNVDSKRIIMAHINEDGTVSPIL